MNHKKLSTSKAEHQLLSKEAIKLPPKQRLELLLKADVYPIVRKMTSAEGQIREMIDLYNFCCLMLVQYFPNKQAESNFFLLSLIASQENIQSLTTRKIEEAFSLLNGYEGLERKIAAIQMLFYQYQYSFPDLYESYNLEEISTECISDIIQENKQLMKDNSQHVEEILNRWELLS